MIPLRQVIPEALAVLIREAPLTREKVAFAWRNVVGPAIARATDVELREGVLHVQARDAAWGQEVERSAALIRSRLHALLGNDVVRYIRVTAEPEAARSSRPSQRPGRYRA